MKRLCSILGIFLIAAGATTAASGQISVPGVPLPQLPRLPVGTDPVTGTVRTATSALTEARKLRVRELLHTERATVESDPDGQPILRRQVGALSPTPAALEGARAAGFKVLRTEADYDYVTVTPGGESFDGSHDNTWSQWFNVSASTQVGVKLSSDSSITFHGFDTRYGCRSRMPSGMLGMVGTNMHRPFQKFMPPETRPS